MKLLGRITKRHVMAVLIAVSVVTIALGKPAAWRLRNLLQPILSPLGDAGMYLTVAMRKNITAAADRGLSLQEQERLRHEFDVLRGYAAYWKWESEKRLEQLETLRRFQQSYGPVKDLPCELIPARVVGEVSLPYEQGRSLNVGKDAGAEPGELVLFDGSFEGLAFGLGGRGGLGAGRARDGGRGVLGPDAVGDGSPVQDGRADPPHSRP